jgi:hypothetical protein
MRSLTCGLLITALLAPAIAGAVPTALTQKLDAKFQDGRSPGKGLTVVNRRFSSKLPAGLPAPLYTEWAVQKARQPSDLMLYKMQWGKSKKGFVYVMQSTDDDKGWESDIFKSKNGKPMGQINR